LHAPSVRLAGPDEELPETETTHGRTGRGLTWSFRVPGFPKPVAVRKSRREPTSQPRAPIPSPSPVVPEEQIEFLSDELRAREAGVRELLEKMDANPAGATLGPAKGAELWEIGIRTPEAIARAPFDQLAALPGFGTHVAREVVRAAGGDPPPSLPRPRRTLIAPRPRVEIAAPAPVADRPPEPGGSPPTSIDPEPPAAKSGAPVAAPPRPAEASAPSPSPPPRPAPAALAPEAEPTIAPPPGPAVGTIPDVPPPPAPPAEPVAELPPSVAPSDSPASVETSEGAPAETPLVTEELGATPTAPVPEAVLPAAAPPAPDEGIQLLASDSRTGLWERFLEATAAGHKGLCVSRESPDRLKIYLGDRDVQFAWISPVARPGALRPSDLVGISLRIRTALEDQGVTAVYLEGLEYLVSLHSAERTLPTLQELDALARARHARLWIPVNPTLLPGPELERLAAGLAAGPSPPMPPPPTAGGA
ncbi:MAG TPA: DUF835 domain-containing protein, partial [Thermoplasmata archaeon]|nr:DUF835 domain-containing protein [Thermoplasmata archaeon]